MTSDISINLAIHSDRPLVKNLVPYYLYDMAEYMGWDCNAEGRWDGCYDLPDYWEKSDHFPYLIKVDGRLAGFVLVRPYLNDPSMMEIGEFFVARIFKGRGVGRQSACRVFDAHPGQWMVRVLDGNGGARKFWTKVIGDYTSNKFEHSEGIYSDPLYGDWDMQFFKFRSGVMNGND